MDRPAVAVLFGGRSSEHSISSATAGGVLRRDRPRPLRGDPGRHHPRRAPSSLEDDDPAKFALDADDAARGRRQRHRACCWPEVGGDRELARAPRRRHGRPTSATSTSCFPILHGRSGEDGTDPGLLRHCSSCRTRAAACSTPRSCMDKHFTKIVLQAAGVAVAPWVTVTRARLGARPRRRAAHAARARPAGLRQACARRVERRRRRRCDDCDELDAALELAFAEDDKVLIETGDRRAARSSVGVLEGRDGGARRAHRSPARSCCTGARVLRLRGASTSGGDGVELSARPT